MKREHPNIFPKDFHRRGMEVNGFFIVPAFAANEGNLIPQVNIGNVQPDDFDLPEALKQKESDNRSQT